MSEPNKPTSKKSSMPPPEWVKDKAEAYQLLGGINTKVSLYSNVPTEFRDISNLNFVLTGSLSKRPGTTLYPGVTFAGTSAGGVTSGVPDLRQITSGYEYSNLSGKSFMIISQFNALYQVFNNGYSPLISYLGFNPPLSQIGSIWSFVTFVDHLFACNGSQFYRISNKDIQNQITPQLNAFNYSVPSGVITYFSPFYPTIITGNQLICDFAPLTIPQVLAASMAMGLSGTYVMGYALVNDRGFIGPPSNGITFTFTPAGASTFNAAAFVFGGLQTAINNYGVTAILLLRSEIDGVVMAGTTMVAIPNGNGASLILYDYGATLLNTAIVASQDIDVTLSGGVTFIVGYTGVPSYTGTLYYDYLQNPGTPLFPRYLEVYNNQMFMAGFSTMPSTFWWSEIGEPEGVQPDFSVEVRSNDGDRITGMKQYFGSLVISKRNSIHLLSGTDPTNFTLQELSDQYGCLSHRAMVAWNNTLWFLDTKGIMEYNGANIRCVSTKVEPIFNSMNIDAALDNACGIHVKQFNEVWFSIPANGSTINNMIVVYDYVADSWTHYDGIQAQCLFTARAGMPVSRPFYGGYTGGLMYFDPSLNSDNDQGITCSFKSLFLSARGQSIESMYRRFFLNVNPILGFTQPINLTFQTNFGTTAVYTATMYQNPYQSRIDFGLSARTLQIDMYHYSASLPLVINGFTVESRYQRSV